MRTSNQGKDFIKSYEALRLAAYDDGVGVWTIGWGHTKGVKPGDTCTKEQSDAWFDEELETFENGVIALILQDVTQEQFDALCSLAYNIGLGAFSKSTLLRKLNAGDISGAAEQFDVWNRGGGKVMLGLVKRRAGERKIFENGIYEMHK